jgi:hypothetical protein
MAVISSGNHPKALWPGVKAWWGRGYDEFEQCWMQLFDEEGSTQSYEEDVEVTGFGLAPSKSEGSGISYDSESQGETTRYTNAAYALGYIVTYEELKDGLYETVSKRRAQALGFSMRQTKETVLHNIYNRATNSSYTFGDGKEILATDHPTESGDQQNEPTTAVDFSEAALEDLLILIHKAKNARGLRINLQPQKLIGPPDLKFEFERVLKSSLQNDSANNAINAVKSMGLIPGGYFVSPFLDDTDQWFIRTNCPNGMKVYNRESTDFQQDNDFDTKNAKAASYMRFVGGVTDWRSLYGSPGA